MQTLVDAAQRFVLLAPSAASHCIARAARRIRLADLGALDVGARLCARIIGEQTGVEFAAPHAAFRLLNVTRVASAKLFAARIY